MRPRGSSICERQACFICVREEVENDTTDVEKDLRTTVREMPLDMKIMMSTLAIPSSTAGVDDNAAPGLTSNLFHVFAVYFALSTS